MFTLHRFTTPLFRRFLLPFHALILAAALAPLAHAVDTGWSYSFGVSSRRIGVGFDLGAPAAVNTAGA